MTEVQEDEGKMMTTAAEKVVVEKKDEKVVEKRRALGRGLESLLPGPRVVGGSAESRVASAAQGLKSEAGAGAVVAAEPVPFPGGPDRGQTGGGETVLPRFARDDKAAQGDEVAAAALEAMASAEREPGRTAVSAPHGQGEEISIQAMAMPGNLVVDLDIGLIDKNPYQTRYVFEEELLKELAASIKEQGVVQPVVVRPAEEEGRYVLVLGERRLRASKLAGRDSIPALVRRLSEQQAAEMTVLENIVREDLNPVEQAEAFRVLSTEFNLTQAQIAQRIGVSRETVSNYMRLLRLPEDVMTHMLEGRLSFSDAREILSLDNPAHIPQLAAEVVAKHLKLDEIEERVRELNGFVAMQQQEGAGQRKAGGARWMDPNVRAAQTEMERTLGMRVRIRDRNGKGRIVIEYASVDDYERVIEMLRGKKK